MKRAIWMVVLVAACATSRTHTPTVTEGGARIARLEQARSTGDGELAALAEHLDPTVRARAVRALGRMPWPNEGATVTRALLARLFDTDANVRAEAAFALGMRADPTAGDKLAFVALDFHLADADPLVRARAVEALSKLERSDLHERLLGALDDSDPRVRLEAAQGVSRWPTSAGIADQRLIRHLELDPDERVRTYALFALDRRKSTAALETFLRFADSEIAEQRIYAARGLRHSIEAPKALAAAIDALRDEDARVAFEATLVLGESRAPQAFEALAIATHHASPHVRRGAWEALGVWTRTVEHRSRVAAIAEKLPLGGRVKEQLAAESSAAVRAAMLATLLPLSERLLALEEPEMKRESFSWSFAELRALTQADTDWIGIAQGLARTRHASSVEVLAQMARLPPLAVREAALEALMRHKGQPARAELLSHLDDADNGVRLAAVLALVEMLEPGDVEAFARCYESTHGDGTPEVRFNIVKLLPALGGDAAKALARRALFDEHPFVRRTAREEYAKLAKGDADLDEQLARSLAQGAQSSESIESAEALPATPPGVSPRVTIVTSRGAMVFELLGEEAPLHVANFLALAERDYYDGLSFHRVVPDFVIQGGCYRGDGNGGGTWRGREDSLEHEISPRKYVRGSLGMPRWDDVDSGGSQFFVTHRATPHLDGRYTIFGELREGFEVLDAIDIGDAIVDVVVTRE